MIYLYVPFNNSEANRKLTKIASQWRDSTYKSSDVACTVLCSDDKFASNESSIQKTKIYILAYEAIGIESTGIISSSPDSVHYTLNSEQLIDRLLASGLPEKGIIDIKLCIKYNGPSDNSMMLAESIREGLLKKNYKNLNLFVRVQYSEENFPGETYKLSYYNVGGSLPIFFPPAHISTEQSTTGNDCVDQASSIM